MFTQACQTLNMDTFLKFPCERQDHSLRAPLFFFHAPHYSALRLLRSRSPLHSRGNALESDAYRASATRGKAAAAHSTGIARPATSSAHLGTSQSTDSQRTTHRNSNVAISARNGRSHNSCGKRQKKVENPLFRCQLSASPSRLMASFFLHFQPQRSGLIC